jgi:molybdopterin converting factor small subunit
MVTVELFGVPRQRAGRAEVQVVAGTVTEVLAALVQACPGLAGLVQQGRLSPHYLLSLDGREFVSDPARVLHPGDRLLLLSADAGG